MGCVGSKPVNQGISPDGSGPGGVGTVAQACMPLVRADVVSSMAKLETARSNIHVDGTQTVGEGVFGMVYEAKADVVLKGAADAKTISVVVKKLRQDASPLLTSFFMKEVQALQNCDNENIIKLLGVVTVDNPMLMLLEYCSNGCLKSYLQNCRVSSPLAPHQQLIFAKDVALGMKYLSGLKVVMKDLVRLCVCLCVCVCVCVCVDVDVDVDVQGV